jgi:hypothetical protein
VATRANIHRQPVPVLYKLLDLRIADLSKLTNFRKSHYLTAGNSIICEELLCCLNDGLQKDVVFGTQVISFASDSLLPYFSLHRSVGEDGKELDLQPAGLWQHPLGTRRSVAMGLVTR